MLDDDRQAVRLGIERDGQVLVPDLGEGLVGEVLQLAGLDIAERNPRKLDLEDLVQAPRQIVEPLPNSLAVRRAIE